VVENAQKVIYSFAKELLWKLDSTKKGQLNWVDFKEYKIPLENKKEPLISYLYSLT